MVAGAPVQVRLIWFMTFTPGNLLTSLRAARTRTHGHLPTAVYPGQLPPPIITPG